MHAGTRICAAASGIDFPQVEDSKWKLLESELANSTSQRAQLRAILTANPKSPDAEFHSRRISELNDRVAEIERKLSYARTPPVSTDPNIGRPPDGAQLADSSPAASRRSPSTASVSAISQEGYRAEELAREQRCNVQPRATLIGKGTGFETYSISCSNGDALAIRCESGNCRVLQ